MNIDVRVYTCAIRLGRELNAIIYRHVSVQRELYMLCAYGEYIGRSVRRRRDKE